QAVGAGARSRFRGFAAISALDYHAATSADTVCPWCEMHCQRSFIDVAVDEGAGRPWSKVKLDPGWLRLIVNNACPKGLLENAHEVKAVKNELDRLRDETLDTAQLVQDQAFRAPR
ncbi:MAG: activase, partial [Rubrivivax sp.]|nr:activase [Rubrivivax sp.]